MRQIWNGDPAAGLEDYVEWLVERSYLRLSRHETRLRAALQSAGLPVRGCSD